MRWGEYGSPPTKETPVRKKLLLLALSFAALAGSLSRVEAGGTHACPQCITYANGSQCCVSCICDDNGPIACTNRICPPDTGGTD